MRHHVSRLGFQLSQSSHLGFSGTGRGPGHGTEQRLEFLAHPGHLPIPQSSDRIRQEVLQVVDLLERLVASGIDLLASIFCRCVERLLEILDL